MVIDVKHEHDLRMEKYVLYWENLGLLGPFLSSCKSQISISIQVIGTWTS